MESVSPQSVPSSLPPGAGATEARKRPLRDLWRLFGPYWSCERRDKVRGAALLLLILTMAQVGLAVWSNYWQRPSVAPIYYWERSFLIFWWA